MISANPQQTKSKLHTTTAAAFLLLLHLLLLSHPGLSSSLNPHGPKQPVFPHQAEDELSQMEAALAVSPNYLQMYRQRLFEAYLLLANWV